MRQHLFPFFLCAFALAACDGPVDPARDAGGGPDGGGPSDTLAPSVRSTEPEEGASGVARDAELVVRFSEPMASAEGTIRVAPGDSVMSASQGEWDAAGSTLTIRPEFPWPAGEVTLTIQPTFADLAGNALVEHTLTFTTEDDIRPSVVETTPSEGATGLSARLGAIVIRFDEAMRTSAGTLDVLGGAATVAAATWSADGTTATFPVTDLEYEREYDVVLRDFVDVAGNRFAPAPYLEDGVLDFTTGADTDGPKVIRAEPGEGQVDVDPARMAAILVTFDEVMDTSLSTVTLASGGSSREVEGTWTGGGRIFRVDATGLLEFDTAYALDLGSLADRAGNAVDGAAYLGDGRLDFTVGPDAFMPFVRASTPVEGETDVAYAEITEIEVSFSEAMDTSITTATLSGGAAPVALTGAWTGGTELRFDVAGQLPAGAALSLDLTHMRDALGNPLDAAHRYLADGRLDFTTGAPVGEGCRDPLTVAEATLTDGTYSWTIGSLQAAARDGGTAYCDSNGATSNGTDVLVRFDKVSGTVGSGGRLLRVVLDGSTSTTTGTTPYDLAVMTGASCDPSAAPLRCHSNQAFQQLDLDLAAGPVWVWVSRTIVSSSSASVVLSIGEVDPPRVEGDACEAPFTTSSAIYSAPGVTGGVHRFAIGQNSLRSVDIGPYSNVAPNVFSCDTALGHGIDGVVRFDKPDDTSLLRVSARRTAGSDTFNLEVFDACDATASGTARHGCRTAVSTTAVEMLVDAPAGPLYLWVGDTTTTVSRSSSAWQYNPAIEIDVEVIPDVQAGEVCSRAIAAAAGPNTVAGTSARRLQAPSCFGATSNVEWYRVRTTQPVLLARTDAAGGLALHDPATASEISCVADAQAGALTRVLPVGTDYCVGVEMGRGITTLTITGQDYTGLGSRAPVDLEIQRPLNSTASAEESVTSDYWMAVNDSTLIMRHTSSAVMDVSRAGHERAVRRGTDDAITSTQLGRTGVSVNGAIFSFTSSTGATTSRVIRLWDGRSPLWTPTTWDLGPTYVTQAIQAAARDGSSAGILYVTDGSTTTSRPTFYRIDTAAPSTPVLVGQSTRLGGVRGMVVDDSFVYVIATVDTVRGVYRVPRGDVTAEPVPLAQSTSFSTSTTQASAMALDSLTAPANLYVRNASGAVEVIIAPAGASPFYLGPVIDRGRAGDWAMTLDVATGQLFLFETLTVSTGTWVRYDP